MPRELDTRDSRTNKAKKQNWVVHGNIHLRPCGISVSISTVSSELAVYYNWLRCFCCWQPFKNKGGFRVVLHTWLFFGLSSLFCLSLNPFSRQKFLVLYLQSERGLYCSQKRRPRFFVVVSNLTLLLVALPAFFWGTRKSCLNVECVSISSEKALSWGRYIPCKIRSISSAIGVYCISCLLLQYVCVDGRVQMWP